MSTKQKQKQQVVPPAPPVDPLKEQNRKLNQLFTMQVEELKKKEQQKEQIASMHAQLDDTLSKLQTHKVELDSLMQQLVFPEEAKTKIDEENASLTQPVELLNQMKQQHTSIAEQITKILSSIQKTEVENAEKQRLLEPARKLNSQLKKKFETLRSTLERQQKEMAEANESIKNHQEIIEFMNSRLQNGIDDKVFEVQKQFYQEVDKLLELQKPGVFQQLQMRYDIYLDYRRQIVQKFDLVALHEKELQERTWHQDPQEANEAEKQDCEHCECGHVHNHECGEQKEHEAEGCQLEAQQQGDDQEQVQPAPEDGVENMM